MDRAFRFKRWARSGWAAFASMHRRVSIGVLSVGMSLIALHPQISSARDVDSAVVFRQLDSSVVISEKASPTRSVMRETVIFNRKQASSAAYQTLESVLRVSPSTDVRERGGKAVQADISIRGGSSDQTQVMLNGINFTDARTGHQTHSLPIDVDCISGIELLDGVLGVGAYAGAINFKSAPLYPDYWRLNATGGQYGYSYLNLSGAKQLKKTQIFGAVSRKHSNGYTNNTDFTNVNAYDRIMIDLGKAGSIDMQAGFQARDFGANGFYSLKYPDQYESTRTGIASIRYLLQTDSGWEFSASAHSRVCTDRFELIRGDESHIPFNHHITLDIGAEAWAGRTWALGKTTIGGDWTRNGVLSTVLGEALQEKVYLCHSDIGYTHKASRNTGNFWIRHSVQRSLWSLALSGGISVHPYGTSGTGSAEFSFYPAKGARIYAGTARSMRLPTFTDLYYTATGYIANDSLVPEKATIFRSGAEYASGPWAFSALGYVRFGTNIIDWIKYPGEDVWRSMQITSMNTYGAELSARWHAAEGLLRNASLSYSHIYSDKDSGGNISRYALDYMRNKLSANVVMALPCNLDFSTTGTLYDRAGTDRPYFLLDARLGWTKGIMQIFAEATNITCTKYSDFTGLTMPSIWADAGIILTMKPKR